MTHPAKHVFIPRTCLKISPPTQSPTHSNSECRPYFYSCIKKSFFTISWNKLWNRPLYIIFNPLPVITISGFFDDLLFASMKRLNWIAPPYENNLFPLNRSGKYQKQSDDEIRFASAWKSLPAARRLIWGGKSWPRYESTKTNVSVKSGRILIILVLVTRENNFNEIDDGKTLSILRAPINRGKTRIARQVQNHVRYLCSIAIRGLAIFWYTWTPTF